MQSLLEGSVLEVTRVTARILDHPEGDQEKKRGPPAVMIPLTVLEVRRLLLTLTNTMSAEERWFRVAWSRWCRRHQAQAQQGHQTRRTRLQLHRAAGESAVLRV